MSDLSYIFLMSSDRSGSNLCLRLLGANPDISAPPTSQLIPNLYRYENLYADLNVDENWASLLKNTMELHRASFGQWAIYADLFELNEHSTHRSVALILRTIFEAEAAAHQKKLIALKTHRTFEYSDRFLNDFPNAKFIYLVRDPRDMCLSWLKTPALRGGVARAAEIWQTEQAGFLSLSTRLGKRVHYLKYEDILDQPEETLIDLCRFLSIDFRDDMLEFHARPETRNIAGHVQAWNNLSRPLMSRNSSKYKTELSREQWVHIEAMCRVEMEKLGYKCDLDISSYNLEEISENLKQSAPWEKPEYMELSQAERDSHVTLREAVRTLAEGPTAISNLTSPETQ